VAKPTNPDLSAEYLRGRYREDRLGAGGGPAERSELDTGDIERVHDMQWRPGGCAALREIFEPCSRPRRMPRLR
jgi:hypothetical protein